jgi:hypothetical protein
MIAGDPQPDLAGRGVLSLLHDALHGLEDPHPGHLPTQAQFWDCCPQSCQSSSHSTPPDFPTSCRQLVGGEGASHAERTIINVSSLPA